MVQLRTFPLFKLVKCSVQTEGNVLYPLSFLLSSFKGVFIEIADPCQTEVTHTCMNLVRVATVRENSGKTDFFSRSGKSQGILYQVMEILNATSKSANCRGICFRVATWFWIPIPANVF